MNTKEILTIIALSVLGLCLICSVAKMVMKNDKAKKGCDHACSLLVFVAVILLAISQLLGENYSYEAPPPTPADCTCPPNSDGTVPQCSGPANCELCGVGGGFYFYPPNANANKLDYGGFDFQDSHEYKCSKNKNGDVVCTLTEPVTITPTFTMNTATTPIEGRICQNSPIKCTVTMSPGDIHDVVCDPLQSTNR